MSEDTTNEFRPTPGTTLDQWTDTEWQEFTRSLTWENFQLAHTPDGQPYTRVTLPQRLDQAALSLIEVERQQASIFGGVYDVLEEESTQLDDSIREISATHNLPEEAEIAIRESPEVQEAFADTGYPDEIQTAKQELSHWGNSLLRTIFKALLDLGLREAYRNVWMPEYRAYYAQIPDSERPRWNARAEQFKKMRELINGDSEAGTEPNFLVLSSKGKSIFATTPEIAHLEQG